MTTSPPVPRRGEVWLCDFDPTKGSEIRKTRPAVVLSSDSMGILPLKLVAPITGWKEKFDGRLWFVKLAPTKANGLTKEGAVDLLQVRSLAVDGERFVEKKGHVTATKLEDIVSALALVVEYQ